MRRTQNVSNDVVEGRFQARLRALHRSRLKQAKTVLDDSGPVRYAHLDPLTKPPPRERMLRNRVIQHDNGLLVEKMVTILARKPIPNHDPELLTKAAHATVEDAYRPGPIPLPKSLNKDVRTRQLESIVLENRNFLQRLIASPGVYDKRKWEKQFGSEVKYMEQICKFPYQNPSDTMPQMNPILAIAHAQSDKSAEWILKNQREQWSKTQQQLQLPPVQGFSQTQQFGSTMGSTTASIPPYHSGPGVPNHFPMPPGAYPTPPGSSAGLVPVPPHSARPSTSSHPPGPKLRAQYTSQGVRILKTGRTASRQRPPTTLNTVRTAAAATASGTATPKFQPLRQRQAQQQQHLQQQQFHHQQQQQQQSQSQSQSPQLTSTSAPNQSPLKKENEESKEESSSSQNPSTQANPSSNANAPTETEAPPPGDSPKQLFEDTLVISGRAVLIKIFECGNPWRFEVRVFDPWSALEYTLCLPLTYIKLCFYQVPDLLLPSNRGFLLQTLLHYLAFAPGADGALELLVDIVAPPPRNPAEQLAWTLAHDAAAVDQAQAELQAEKDAFAHVHELAQAQAKKEEAEREERHRKEHEEFERLLKENPEAAKAKVEEEEKRLAAAALAAQEAKQPKQPTPPPSTTEPDTTTTSSSPQVHAIPVEETFVIHRTPRKASLEAANPPVAAITTQTNHQANASPPTDGPTESPLASPTSTMATDGSSTINENSITTPLSSDATSPTPITPAATESPTVVNETSSPTTQQ